MVKMEINSGSTSHTKRVLLALLHDMGKENIADVTLKEQMYGRNSGNIHKVTLEILFHLSDEKDQESLRSAGNIQIVTNDFACRYNGNGSRDLLDVLRAAGIGTDILSDDEILKDYDKPVNRAFSSRKVTYTGVLREVSVRSPSEKTLDLSEFEL